MNLILAETSSSPARVREVIRVRRSVSYLVNGKVEPVEADPALPPMILVLGSKAWPRLWTRWNPSYRLPPTNVLESVWRVTQHLLTTRDDIPRTFGGAFRHGFVWGALPDASGVVARERLLVGGGGLFLEHYCLCRTSGMDEETAMRVTVDMATRGGTTPIPRGE